jgi:uncharacterized protein YqjF (DUF2071 family)
MNANNSVIMRKSIWSSLLCVRMTLRDVCYVSYALPSKILRSIVPKALQMATAGDDMAFISLVALRSTQVRLSTFPVFKFNYNQFNIRTYVIDPVSRQPAVYFIRSGVTSKFISILTRSIGIPWQHIGFNIDFRGPKEVRSATISGDWEGRFSLKVQAKGNLRASPALFQDRKSAVDFLIRPLTGFAGNSQRLVRFNIQHPEVQPESWALEELDCPLFDKLAAIDNTKIPHSVFYLPEADFTIFLPPKRITEKR